MKTNHRIDWEGATCMEFNGFEDERIFLDSWLTNCDENSINICRDMPGAYAGLITHERRLACLQRTANKQSYKHAHIFLAQNKIIITVIFFCNCNKSLILDAV
jgi:hypothetical protein